MSFFPLRSSCIGADEMKNRFISSQCQEEVWLVAIELWGLFTPNETTFSTAADYIRSNHQTGQSSSRSWKTLDFNHNRIISNQKGGGDIRCYSRARNFDFELKFIHHCKFFSIFLHSLMKRWEDMHDIIGFCLIWIIASCQSVFTKLYMES